MATSRIGLALGAGGVLGGAWLVGALAAVSRLTAALRRRSARQVDAELARLSRAGTAVLLLEPGERDLREIGLNVMDARPAPRVAELAPETTREQLERPEMRRLLARLASAGT